MNGFARPDETHRRNPRRADTPAAIPVAEEDVAGVLTTAAATSAAGVRNLAAAAGLETGLNPAAARNAAGGLTTPEEAILGAGLNPEAAANSAGGLT